MKILITGGSGFVGSYIATELANFNHEVFAPNHIDMNCSDSASVKNYIANINPEAIIHTAAMILPTDEMGGNHEKILKENEELNSNVLDQAAMLNIKNIFCFGSHTMYSPSIEKNESNLFLGTTPSFIKGYADSKRLLLQSCNEYSTNGLNYKMLVLPSIYGPFNLNFPPKQMLNSIILRAIKLKEMNEPILDVRGDLTALREYIFLPDVANWVSQNINGMNELPNVMNLGTNSILPILEYYQICSSLLNLNLNLDEEITAVNKLQDNAAPLDCSLASNFGWDIVTPIEEGIMQTFKYIEGNYGI